MKTTIKHVLARLCGRATGSAVIAALVALLAVQVAVPPQLSSFDSQANWQEIDEEEDGEPNESSGEQGLPEFISPACSRPQRAESRFVQRVAATIAHRGQKSLTEFSIPAELVHRNGAGGPLRC
jgi:hypothetical protein